MKFFNVSYLLESLMGVMSPPILSSKDKESFMATKKVYIKPVYKRTKLYLVK